MRSWNRKTSIPGHKTTKQHTSWQQIFWCPRSAWASFQDLCTPLPNASENPSLHWVSPSHGFTRQQAYMCHGLFWTLHKMLLHKSLKKSCKTNLLFLQSRQTHEKRQDRLAASDVPAVPMLWGSGEACTSPFREQLLFACSWWSQLHLETRSEPIKHRGRLLGNGVYKAGKQAKAWLQNFTFCKERKKKKKETTHTAYWAIAPA